MQNFQSVLITAAFPEPYRTQVKEALRPAKITFCSPRGTAVIDQALAEADGGIIFTAATAATAFRRCWSKATTSS